MGIFDGILLVSDLDGTLLRNDKSVSKRNSEALDYFMREGGLFTVMTGRMPYALSTVLDKISVNAPVGCGNGLTIFDTEKNECLWKICIDNKVLDAVRFVRDSFSDMGIEIMTHDNVFCVRTNPSIFKHLSDERLELNECDADTYDGEIGKILFAHTSECLGPMIKALESSNLLDGFIGVRSDITYYEILPMGAGKGAGLMRLAQILGIPLSKTIAVGDNDNDESMIRMAGVGIAVANASQAAHDAADIVTVSNEEDAIAKIIYDIENGTIKI